MDLTDHELRVLGCLVEKAATTPDTYPLTLNALITACNQRSNREPVVDYDDATVIRAIDGLRDRGWIRLTHTPGQRAVKYKHVLGEMLDLDERALALLAVLMLRGEQTPGELRTRTGRYVDFSSLDEVEEVMHGLIGRELATRLERRPGEKENRYRHLLGDSAAGAAIAAAGAAIAVAQTPGDDLTDVGVGRPADDLADRVAALEAEVARLSSELAALRAALGEE
jgi:uncharacterized protein YceH (UPF0502 family)